MKKVILPGYAQTTLSKLKQPPFYGKDPHHIEHLLKDVMPKMLLNGKRDDVSLMVHIQLNNKTSVCNFVLQLLKLYFAVINLWQNLLVNQLQINLEKDAKDWHGITIIFSLLHTAADRKHVIVLHIQNYSRTLTEYRRLKSGMKSKGNGTCSAWYIIDAVGVSKELELSRFYCILNCTYNMLGLANYKKLLLISSVIIVIIYFVLLCWVDDSYFMKWSFGHSELFY